MAVKVLTAEQLRSLPPVVDVETAARALGLGRNTAYRLAKAGQLPGALRLGHKWKVRTSALLEAVGVTPKDAA